VAAKDASARKAKIALVEWNKCEIANARTISKTSLPSTEAAARAQEGCAEHKAEWIDAEVGAGMPRSLVESTASESERQNFPKLVIYIDRLRGTSY
jgi:hypothetical protein